jgi:polyisoprenoid-binding protein YceI
VNGAHWLRVTSLAGPALIAGLGAAWRAAWRAAGLAALLAACAMTPPPEPAAAARPASADAQWARRYAALAATGGTMIRLDPQRSSVRIRVFRGGRAPTLGHNHVLAAPEFTGYFFLPAAGPSGAQFDVEFPLDRLALDDPQMRARLGPAFAAELTPGDVANTRAHMLGDDNLQADRYPYIRIHSQGVTGEGERFAARIAVEMHGQSRDLTLPLVVEGLPRQIRASGAFVLRQSDFGVHPYSALGGLIAVQDDVLVEFTLAGG